MRKIFRILAAYDALPEGSPERGALLRTERLHHSHIEHWRKQRDEGALAVPLTLADVGRVMEEGPAPWR